MIMSLFKLPLSIGVSVMRKGDDKFNKTHRTYGNFNVKKNLNYCSDDNEEHTLDIYTNPKKRNGILLIYIHGGAYVYGTNDAHRIFVSWYVNQGFDVAAINYRLGQKNGSISIMDQVKDAYEALKFVLNNKDYYDIKTDNIFFVGDSAGGHISLMLDILLHNKEAQEYYQINDVPKVNLRGIALNSTMYDYNLVVKMSNDMLFKKGRKWMLSSRYKDEEFVKKNSPRYYYKNSYKSVPLFASTAYHDYFNSQTTRLKKDADELGIDLDYLFESSPDKKIGHVYNHFNFENEEGKRCNDRMVEFFIKNSKVAK